MLYAPIKVTVAEDQLERLKYDLKKPFLSIKIRLKGKKVLMMSIHYFSRVLKSIVSIVLDLHENEHLRLYG